MIEWLIDWLLAYLLVQTNIVQTLNEVRQFFLKISHQKCKILLLLSCCCCFVVKFYGKENESKQRRIQSRCLKQKKTVHYVNWGLFFLVWKGSRSLPARKGEEERWKRNERTEGRRLKITKPIKIPGPVGPTKPLSKEFPYPMT